MKKVARENGSHQSNYEYRIRRPMSYLVTILSVAIFLPSPSLPRTAKSAQIINNQITSVRGVVTDKQSKNPVIGARISLPDLNLSTASDRDGAFFFPEIDHALHLPTHCPRFAHWIIAGMNT